MKKKKPTISIETTDYSSTIEAGDQTEKNATGEAADLTEPPVKKKRTTRRNKKEAVDGMLSEELSADTLLNTATLDIGGVKITEKEKRFVFWYTYPGSDAFQVQARAAQKAGYKDYNREGYRLRTKETVAKAIKHIMDGQLKIDLAEQYHKIIELKKRRIFFDIGDYVETKELERYTKGGEPYTIVDEQLKDLSALTPEQRQVIDGIDYRGMEGKKVYIFADRDKAMRDMLTLYESVCGGTTENEEADMEFTAEILKEGLKVKVSNRKKKTDMSKKVAFFESSCEGSEEL